MGLFDTTFPLWQPSPTGDRPLYAQDDGMMPFNLLRALYAPTRTDDNSAFKDALAGAGQGPISFFSGPQAPPPAPGGLPAWASLPAGSNVGLPDTSAARVAARGSEFGDLPLPKQFQPPAPKSDEAFNAPGFKFGPPPAASFPTFGAGAAPVGLAGGGMPGLAPPPPPPNGPAMAAPAVPAGFQGQQPMVPPQPGAPAAPLPPDVQVAAPAGANAGTPAAAAAAPVPQRAAQAYAGGAGGPFPPQDVYSALGQQPAGGTGGGFGGAFRGMVANIGAGPLGMLGGLLGGAMGMGEGTDRQQQLAQMQATFQAARGELMNQGYDKNEASRRAMLIATNPQAAAAGMPELIGNRLEKAITKDETGAEHVRFFDKFTGQEVNPAGGAVAGNGPPDEDFGAAISKMQALKAAGAGPQEILAAAPRKYQDYVKAMIQGRALPQWLGSRSMLRSGLLNMAHIVDDNMNEAELGTRPKTYASWKNGQDASVVRRVDQAGLHFGDLVNDQMPALPGHSFVPANRIANKFNSELLGKDATNNFMINAHALATELGGIWKEHNLSDSQIQEWAKGLSPDMSLEQQRGAARTILKLYRDGVASIEEKRQKALGPLVDANQEMGPIIGPRSEAALKSVEDFANGGKSMTTLPPTRQEAAKKGVTVTRIK